MAMYTESWSHSGRSHSSTAVFVSTSAGSMDQAFNQRSRIKRGPHDTECEPSYHGHDQKKMSFLEHVLQAELHLPHRDRSAGHYAEPGMTGGAWHPGLRRARQNV
jgi:hypothetical protein